MSDNNPIVKHREIIGEVIFLSVSFFLSFFFFPSFFIFLLSFTSFLGFLRFYSHPKLVKTLEEHKETIINLWMECMKMDHTFSDDQSHNTQRVAVMLDILCELMKKVCFVLLQKIVYIFCLFIYSFIYLFIYLLSPSSLFVRNNIKRAGAKSAILKRRFWNSCLRVRGGLYWCDKILCVCGEMLNLNYILILIVLLLRKKKAYLFNKASSHTSCAKSAKS